MKKCLVIVFLVIASVSHAEDKWTWTKTDTALQSVTVALMVVDWGQTLDIADSKVTNCYPSWDNTASVKSTNYYTASEVNPILGEHPSRGSVNLYFASVIVGHTAVARLLPKPYRTFWQAIWIGGEITAVGHNHTAGFRVKF